MELVVIAILLLVGWTVGTARERAHFRSLEERERHLGHILVTDIKTFPPAAEPAPCPTLVMGQAVIASDYLKSFVANLRRIVGGELRSYETLMTRARREAIVRMMEKAHAGGYNAVCNVRLTTADIGGMSGARGAVMVEAFVAGTAYRIPS